MKVRGDSAIKNENEDRLDRSAFATHLATGILNWTSSESLCLALEGPWGSGKSSVLNLALNKVRQETNDLEKNKQPIIINFKPWLFSGTEKLVRAFLSELGRELGKSDSSEIAREAASHLLKYERLLNIGRFIPGISEFAGAAKEVVGDVKGVVESFTNSENGTLEDNKELTSKSLEKLESKVIIVVDDVDRLASGEIKQIFQLIKSVADFPNTIYLLSYDPRVVEKATADLQPDGRTNYIEKIVQVSFEVPEPSKSKILEILWEGLDDITANISNEDDEQIRWNETRFGAFRRLFYNIRDVKRFLNHVNFKFPIIKGEVSTLDLMLLEALHQFTPKLYQTIKANKSLFVSDSYSEGQVSDEQTKWHESLLELAPSEVKGEAKEILTLLFPKVLTSFTGRGWGSGFTEIWNKGNRVCMSAYFDYYFQGDLADGEVSNKETEEIFKLDSFKKIKSALLIYFEDNRIGKVLEKLKPFLINNFDEEKAILICRGVIEAAEEAPVKPNLSYCPTKWSIDYFLADVIREIDKPKRKSFLIEVLKDCDSVSAPVSLVRYAWLEWYGDKRDKTSEEEKIFLESDINELKKVILTSLDNARNSQTLHEKNDLVYILYFWKEAGEEEEVLAWINEVLQDEKKIIPFLRGFGSFSSSTIMGSNYSTYKFSVHKKSLEPFTDIDQLKEKCENLINDENLSDDDKVLLQGFIESFKPENDF